MNKHRAEGEGAPWGMPGKRTAADASESAVSGHRVPCWIESSAKPAIYFMPCNPFAGPCVGLQQARVARRARRPTRRPIAAADVCRKPGEIGPAEDAMAQRPVLSARWFFSFRMAPGTLSAGEPPWLVLGVWCRDKG